MDNDRQEEMNSLYQRLYLLVEMLRKPQEDIQNDIIDLNKNIEGLRKELQELRNNVKETLNAFVADVDAAIKSIGEMLTSERETEDENGITEIK